jgi:Coenzyme PQQ synthesis protein D (PqqD)
MTNVPRRRSDVSVRHLQGEIVVLDRRADLVHQLNRTAGFIWERCDGRTTPQDIADQLVEVFAVDAGTAVASVTAALRQLEQLGLLESTGP